MTVLLARRPITTSAAPSTQIVSLAQTLQELGLRPYTCSSVKRYKQIKALGAVPWRSLLLQIAYFALPILIFLSGVSFAISWCAIIIMIIFSAAPGWSVGINVGSLALIPLCFLGLYCISEKRVRCAEWVRVNQSYYNDPVPAHVQQTITDIRSRCPQAELWIEELILYDKTLDPLLIAVDQNGEYYLEAWDEPAFA